MAWAHRTRGRPDLSQAFPRPVKAGASPYVKDLQSMVKLIVDGGVAVLCGSTANRSRGSTEAVKLRPPGPRGQCVTRHAAHHFSSEAVQGCTCKERATDPSLT